MSQALPKLPPGDFEILRILFVGGWLSEVKLRSELSRRGHPHTQIALQQAADRLEKCGLLERQESLGTTRYGCLIKRSEEPSGVSDTVSLFDTQGLRDFFAPRSIHEGRPGPILTIGDLADLESAVAAFLKGRG